MKKGKTFLMLAGVLALTGCTTKVMDDRFYESPKDESGKPIRVDSIPNPRPMPDEPEKAALKNTRGSAYTPMTIQDEDKIGLDDKAAPKTGIKGGKVSAGGTYIVKKNDTLSRIAHKNHVSLSALMKANNMTEKDARRLRVGQKLVIPGGKGVYSSGKSTVRGKGRKTAAAAPAATGKGLNADGTYTVRRGDNIPRIARKFGVRARALQEANGLSDEATRKLQVGQKLVIPAGGKAVSAPKAAAKKKAAAPKQEVKTETPAQTTTLPPPAAQDSTTVTGTPAPAQSAAPAAAAQPAPDSGVNSADTATDFLPVGDAKTLAEFAAKHGTTVEKLRQLNTSHANSDKLEPGEYLFVPAHK